MSSFVFRFNRTLGHARFVYKKINTFEQFTNMSINRDAATVVVVAAVTKYTAPNWMKYTQSKKKNKKKEKEREYNENHTMQTNS